MKYKLEECIEEIVDKTTENNQYEVLSVTKDGIYSQEKFFKKQIASEDNTGYKIIRKNNLVFSTMNLWMGSLDVLSNYEIGIVSPAYKIFKFDESKMIPSFGKYFMKSHFMLEQYKNCSEQGASVVRRNLDLKQLLDTEITIPTVEEQCKIVKVLENIDEIINKYTNLIKNKEQFIKSQFVEMFKKSNTKDFLYNISNYLSRGKSPNYVENSKIKVINQACIYWDEFKYSNAKYQDELKINKSLDKMIKNGDVLITSTGTGTLGRCNVFQGEENKYIADGHVSILRLKENIINPIYFKYYIMQEKTQERLYAECVNGSTNQIELAKDKLLKFEILVPDLNLQNEFVQIVQLIDKQKFHSVFKNITKVKESEVYA